MFDCAKRRTWRGAVRQVVEDGNGECSRGARGCGGPLSVLGGSGTRQRQCSSCTALRTSSECFIRERDCAAVVEFALAAQLREEHAMSLNDKKDTAFGMQAQDDEFVEQGEHAPNVTPFRAF